MSSEDESGDVPPTNEGQFTERIFSNKGMRGFLIVDHSANLRKNSKISAIWHHGDERRRLDDKSMGKYWRCAYCTGKPTVLKVDGGNGGQTTYALTHLKNKHKIDCAIDEDAIPSSIAALGATASAGAQIISTVATKAVREAYGDQI
jgi:hypothetical protein